MTRKVLSATNSLYKKKRGYKSTNKIMKEF